MGWGLSDSEYRRLVQIRAEHPDDFFGKADVICCLRAQIKRREAGQKLYTFEQLLEIVAQARKKYGKQYQTRFAPEVE